MKKVFMSGDTEITIYTDVNLIKAIETVIRTPADIKIMASINGFPIFGTPEEIISEFQMLLYKDSKLDGFEGLPELENNDNDRNFGGWF